MTGRDKGTRSGTPRLVATNSYLTVFQAHSREGKLNQHPRARPQKRIYYYLFARPA